MNTSDFPPCDDPNDAESATENPKRPSCDSTTAIPDVDSCPLPDIKTILANLPDNQREELSVALKRAIEDEKSQIHVAMAAAWHLLYESAYEIATLGATIAKDNSETGVFGAARQLKAQADRIYWIARSIGFGTLSSEDIWLKAIVGLEEIEDRLPPNSRTELIEMFRVTHEDFYARHYWKRAVEEATGRSIFTFCGNGAMSPTTLREWLNGKDIAPHNWKAFIDKLRRELPDNTTYLADGVPGTLL